MISTIDTSAGLCLIRDSHECSPCTHCLLQRLTEAGFSIHSQIKTFDENKLDPGILHVFKTEYHHKKTVVRIYQDEAYLHTLLPVPGCSHCDQYQVFPKSEGNETNAVFDPLLGITSCMEEKKPESTNEYLCSSVSSRIHTPGENSIIKAYGQGLDSKKAGQSHFGELLERYCSLHPVRNRILIAPYKEISEHTFPLGILNGYTTQQLEKTGYSELIENSVIGWSEGHALANDRSLYLPSHRVFLLNNWKSDEFRYTPMMSHGTASQKSVEKATINALLEILERFHLTRAWHSMKFGGLIKNETISPDMDSVLKKMKDSGLTLHLLSLDVKPNTIPVVLAMISGNHFPWLVCGSASRPDVAKAAIKATLEACAGWQNLVQNRHNLPSVKELAPVTGAAHNTLYYARKQRAEKIIRIILKGSSHQVKPRFPQNNGKNIREQVLKISPGAAIVNITTPDCTILGYQVVKVISPGLPLLHFGSVGTPGNDLKRFDLPFVHDPHPFP